MSLIDPDGERTRLLYQGTNPRQGLPVDFAEPSSFTECHLGKAGEVLPNLFGSL